jgi:hypothetical protein
VDKVESTEIGEKDSRDIGYDVCLLGVLGIIGTCV